MNKIIYIFIILANCSLQPHEENFLIDITGTYKYSRKIADTYFPLIKEELKIKKDGDFYLFGQSAQLKKVINETNGIYLIDDLLYVGVFINKPKLTLQYIVSSNQKISGIPHNPVFSDTTTFAKKGITLIN